MSHALLLDSVTGEQAVGQFVAMVVTAERSAGTVSGTVAAPGQAMVTTDATVPPLLAWIDTNLRGTRKEKVALPIDELAKPQLFVAKPA